VFEVSPSDCDPWAEVPFDAYPPSTSNHIRKFLTLKLISFNYFSWTLGEQRTQ